MSAILFCGCVKEPSETPIAGGCDGLNSIHQITGTTVVQIGEPITVSVPEIEGYRIFSWIGPNNFTSQYPSNDITTYAELKYEGWYYVHVSNPDCPPGPSDSIYIDVKLKQGSPGCTTISNNITYSDISIPDEVYSNVYKGINSSYGVFGLSAGNMYSDIDILFHPYWNNHEPEDGIYDTNDSFSYDPTDANYNKLFVSTVNQSILWTCSPNQQVYVSHENGKLKVRFCDLVMSGSNGTSYTTHATGDLTEQ